MRPLVLRRLRVWFLLCAALCSLAPTALATTRVLCLGDSLTEGYGVAKEAAWPALVQNELRAKGYKDVELINAGISGSTSASAVSRLKWHLKGKDKAQIVLLELGANDGLRGLDLKALRANVTAAVRLAKSSGMKVLLAGMLIPPNYGPAYTKEFGDIFPAVAKEENVALIPFFLDGVAAKPELNLADRIHPNEAGHKIVAKNAIPHLEGLLKP